jgi:homogentisate phytyltransferase / homogentisate geranylgeranyltransferase
MNTFANVKSISCLMAPTGGVPRQKPRCPPSKSIITLEARSSSAHAIKPRHQIPSIASSHPFGDVRTMRSTHPSFLARASAESLVQPEDLPLTATTSPTSSSDSTNAIHILASLYRFTRPHTMLGTFVSVVSVSLLALGGQGITPTATAALGQALVAALLMNISIVGINQIYDIEIDRINKPYLPLAAGDFSVSLATAVVWITGAASLAVGLATGSPPLLATLTGSLLLGIAYSTDLPFLRWKKYPVAAAACILAVRAVLVQIGFFCHMQHSLGAAELVLTRPVIFATGFMLMFSIVIALFKDLPDIAGDKKAGVRTLSVRLGQERVFWLCIALLEVAYIGAAGVSLFSASVWRRVAGVAAHVVVGGLIWWRANRTNLKESKSIYACYMDVWKAFYAEYLLLPLLI